MAFFETFDNTDLEAAVNGPMAGSFGVSGQSCVTGSRLYLQESIFDKFLDSMVTQAGNIVIGDPLDDAIRMGPLATTAQIDRIEHALTCRRRDSRGG